MSISVNDIRELREKTGAGMMDCKNALQECNGDIEKSIICLRKKGLAGIKDRSAKTASEGIVGHYIHAGGKIGVIVEINCETDFVAKGEAFQQFAKDVAMHIAASNPLWITRDEVPQDIIEREKEIFVDSLGGKPQQIIEKIIKGKMNRFFKETCLMEQLFVKDTNFTITDLFGDLASKVSEKMVVKRFTRYVVGE
ncbi:hypothetical protein LCGC14_1662560 [marine sediment metagenome]|uniref:Translation elongation factor EFTs/EF1B dimerisation domain-containing protein n=1 Tax=marine sediment metagenome TaxID=412755 RepID=A0A0F9KTQ9_9ZZZZ